MNYKIINKRKAYKEVEKILRECRVFDGFAQTVRLTVLAEIRMKVIQ